MLRALVGAAAIVLVGCHGGAELRERVRTSLTSVTSARSYPAYVTADAEGKRLWKLTRQFYERRGHAPAWIDGSTPLPQVDQLIAALKAATDEGLDPELYSLAILDDRHRDAQKGLLTKRGFDVSEAGALDAWLTYTYMKFASDLADGVSDLAHADPRWLIEPEKFDPASHLEQALEKEKVDASLRQLLPDHPEYHALRKALGQYRTLQAKGGWPTLPANPRLKPGQRSPHIPALAARLAATGDYDGRVPAMGSSAPFSTELETAVKRFQRRHGLQDDGAVGAAVAAEMNVPVEKRIRQIELNLERWRWLPRSLGDRHILVNIPQFHLEVRDHGQVPLAMRVVVGKKDTPTPIFAAAMTYLVFSPYWNVPPTIAQDETLPEVLNDPTFLERTKMEVVDSSGRPIDAASIDLTDPTKYRFRQRPGTHNSLGLVKFMFPNQHHVYLHDTPTDSLFARVSRSFSHGCVRVEQPIELAEYVLRDRPEWTRDRIEQAMQGSEEETVRLATRIPVYLVYWTARASVGGTIEFRKDVYGIDGQQTTRLSDRLSRLRKAARAGSAVGGAPNREATTAARTRSTD